MSDGDLQDWADRLAIQDLISRYADALIRRQISLACSGPALTPRRPVDAAGAAPREAHALDSQPDVRALRQARPNAEQ